MASKTEIKQPELEREYVIPLRNEWRKVANYRRTGRAVKFIKQFIARHMKIPERDVSKVKLDIYLNQEIWFRGRKKPPARIKVKAIKQGDIVKVELAELQKHWQFEKAKFEKRYKPIERLLEKKEEKTEEHKVEEKTEEEKKEEAEKEKAVAQVREAEAKQEAKARKHSTKIKEPKIHRMALKK